MRITPEQRRFLGPARSRHDWVGAEEAQAGTDIPADVEREIGQRSTEEGYVPSTPDARSSEPPAGSGTHSPAKSYPQEGFEPEDLEEGQQSDQKPERQRTRRLESRSTFSRVLELQNVLLLLGGVFVLVVAFYVGKKFDYWRYVIASRSNIQLSASEANRFPNMSAGELVEGGMAEERLGNWKEAADRFIAAKYKNLFYPGLLFRAGKLYYDHGTFDPADTLFERAIAFKEDVDTANYYRGMIANGRGDYPAAERFFEAASNAAPFNADYFYSWGETLRRDHKPKESLIRYEQAARRAGEAEENICRFKMRLAMIEAGEAEKVAADVEGKRRAGSLSVDWLMTDAALQIQAGRTEDAVRLIQEARLADQSLLRGHFAACAGDKFFTEASNKYPEIAEACRLQDTPRPRGLGR